MRKTTETKCKRKREKERGWKCYLALTQLVDQPAVNGTEHDIAFSHQLLNLLVVLQDPFQSHVYLEKEQNNKNKNLY